MKLIRTLLFVAILLTGITYGVLKVREVTRQFDIKTFITDSGFEVSEKPKVFDFNKYKQGDMADLGANIALITFWATWCAPCEEELKDFSKLSRKFSKDKLQIVAIGAGENEESIKKFLKKKSINPQNIIFIPDKENVISKEFDIEFLPVTLVVNKSGRTVAGVMGIRPWLRDEYNEFLDYLIQHQTL